MSLHLADTATRLSGRIVAIACLILPIYVGRMTKSDTFTFALVASGPIFIVLKLRAWLLLSQRRLVIHSAFAWTIALGLPLTLASLVSFVVVAAPDAWKRQGTVERRRQGVDTGVRLAALSLGERGSWPFLIALKTRLAGLGTLICGIGIFCMTGLN